VKWKNVVKCNNTFKFVTIIVIGYTKLQISKNLNILNT